MTEVRWNPPSREAILEALRAAGDPLTPDALAEVLGVHDPGRREILQRRLTAMERDGQLLPNRKGVLLLASKLDFIAGRVIGHRDGFGFVRRDDGGADLFLPARQMQKAMHGDRVLVKQAGEDARGRPEAAIVEITDRARDLLVGRFLNERGVFIVVPEDQRIKHDILVPPDQTSGARHGQVVTCRIVDPPSRNTQPIGRVEEVLGDIGDPGMEIEIAVRKFGVPHEFSAAALEQARRLPDEVRDADVRNRVDLRDVPLITIDGADARDFDDAVYCEPIRGSGNSGRQTGWRLLVAIADVSHYVRPLADLDEEAATRTTSVYFPRRVIPMLPEKLSNGLCSLNPMVDRLAMVCDMVVGMKGNVRAYQFYEAVIRSVARTTYDEVWEMLSGRAGATPLPETPRAITRDALEERVVALHELYRCFVGARAERGAIDFDTTETRIVCDAAGRIERIVPMVRNDAHRLIEECMLAANSCAADFVRRHRHVALFRVHEGPTPEKLATLRAFLSTTGLQLGGGDDPRPVDYAALSQKLRGRPDAELLQTMMLRSMQQAIYSPIDSGHFGLALEHYAHFTSPIRRYPDLLLHRAIRAILHGERYVPRLPESLACWAPGVETDPRDGAARAVRAAAARSPGGAKASTAARNPGGAKTKDADGMPVWTIFGERCSANERRADDASRDVEAWLKCQYMRDRVGEEYAGRITGVAPFGIFITLEALHVEGMVHVSELGSEYFRYNEAGHELRGERTGTRFRLTDPIDVQVARVDLEARRIDFRLVPRTGQRELARAAAPQGKGLQPTQPKAAPAPDQRARKARAARVEARRGKGGKAKTGVGGHSGRSTKAGARRRKSKS